MATRYAVSIDVGGTFTDFVLFDLESGEAAAFHKVLTDAERPARAVIAGWRELLRLANAGAAEVEQVVHSTTLVTNAIVERRGARTALITTQGFRDVLEIGIEQIYDIYDLFAPYPAPLVPRHLRFEVNERLTRDGEVVTSLDESQVRSVLDQIVAEGAEAVAVALIHSYRNPAHETRIAEMIANSYPDLAVSRSSQVAPLIGEYERTSTVVADAYVKPLLRSYLIDLVGQLREEGYTRQLTMMLSSGGITTAEAAMEFPIRLLESGPAAGAFAAGFYGRLTGNDDVLSLDMGGTTAKACLIEEGAPSVARMLEADRVHRFKPGSGLPIMAPTVDLIEIGAGGGSIAHINQLGLLNVGPQSAESNPGPACYGLGGDQPTVTDANVLLGYLDPGYFLGGRMTLDAERAGQAIKTHIAGPLGLSRVEAAWGIHAIVNENMARAARTHLIERNRDPRSISVVAFGGAGPAHAVEVARILGARQVIVPMGAGVASAIGALTAPMALPFVRSYTTSLHGCDWDYVRQLYSEMRDEAQRAVRREGSDITLVDRLAADMRFAGQYHELRIDLPAVNGSEAVKQIEEAFRARYTEVYGRVPSSLSVEVLNWHLTAVAPRAEFRLRSQTSEKTDISYAKRGIREVYFNQPEPGYRSCPVLDRYRLTTGVIFDGPCIIEEREATIVVPPGCRVQIDSYQNIVVTLEKDGQRR